MSDLEIQISSPQYFIDLGEQGPQGLQGPKGDTGPIGPQGPQGIQGIQGVKGDTGATYTPSVSEEGVISWTNNGDLPNPDPIDITGPQGFSPVATVTKTDNTSTITITDSTGTTTAEVLDGTVRFPLFFRFITDHVLSGTDAIGKLLQGSLVTNLYPDAVAHVKADWDNGTVQTFTLGDITFEYKVAQDKHFIVDIANKTQVDSLFELTGIAEFYILDYTNNQFYLPRNLWFDQYTNDPENVNIYNEPALPDHNHTYNTKSSDLPQAGQTTVCWVGNSKATTSNASESNPIYKQGVNTVQPPSSNKLLYFVVGNTYVNQEDIDLAQVESDLNNKLNIDLSNATQTTKSGIVGLVVPDYTAGVSRVSGTYTEDNDGYLIAFANTQDGSSEWTVSIAGINFIFYQGYYGADYMHSTNGIFPIPKGLQYTLTATNMTVVFYPMKGAI